MQRCLVLKRSQWSCGDDIIRCSLSAAQAILRRHLFSVLVYSCKIRFHIVYISFIFAVFFYSKYMFFLKLIPLGSTEGTFRVCRLSLWSDLLILIIYNFSLMNQNISDAETFRFIPKSSFESNNKKRELTKLDFYNLAKKKVWDSQK